MIGRTIARYRIVDKLGEGGMGVVYLAEDLELGRQVAVKVLPEAMAADPGRLERFRREARAIAAINHPAVITLYSVDAADGVHLLTMERVDGEPLTQAIPEGGLPLDRLFGVALQIADALVAAHERGVTHRDLKPANVMVDAGGRVKILDFGLAKLVKAEVEEAVRERATEVVTQEGLVVGTVPYMSPEQLENQEVDHRTDLFSFGVLLYEMATGRRPFKGDSSPALMSSILRDHPPQVTELRDDLPEDLGRLIRDCLEKDPERRIQSAKEIRNGLERLRSEVEAAELAGLYGEHLRAEAGALAAEAATGREGSGERRAGAGRSRAGWIGIAALFAAAALAATLWWLGVGAGASRSIAVLPFLDLSPEGDQVYFSDGISEELINRFAQLPDLRVVGRTSSFAFRGPGLDLRQVGRQLGVGAILEGSVRTAGDRVRVTAQLIDTDTGFHLWSETYDHRLEGIFEVQDQISRAIVEELRLTLDEDAAALERRQGTGTSDVEAYRLYLQGRYFFLLCTGESIDRAIDVFRQSISRDPGFARAYAGLAGAYLAFPGCSSGIGVDPFPLAETAIERALELDRDLAEAHSMLGRLRTARHQWSEGFSAFERALELDPDNPDTLFELARRLMAAGYVEESCEMLARALGLDPVSGAMTGWLGYCPRLRGDDAEALGYMRSAQALGWGPADYFQPAILARLGRREEALRSASGRGPDWALVLEAIADGSSATDPVLRQAARLATDRIGSLYTRLRSYRALGDVDATLATLDRIYEAEGDWAFVYVDVWHVEGAALRRDPRFVAWLDKVGLIELWRERGWPDACGPRAEAIVCA